MPTITPEVIAAAQASQAKWNVPASVTIAQYGLESAWGTRMPKGSNNPFGIKAKAGEPAVVATTVDIVHQQPFRKYASIAEAFDDHGALLNRVALYKPAIKAWLKGDLTGGITLMAAHYATDPHYVSKLRTIINDNDLTRYDKTPAVLVPVSPTVVQQVPLPPIATPAAPTAATSWITVLLGLLKELFRRKDA